MYPTHAGLMFTAKPFHNLSLPLLIQPHLVVLCAWWDIHAMVVWYSIMVCQYYIFMIFVDEH